MNARAVEGKTFSYVKIGFPTKLKRSVAYPIIAGQHIVDLFYNLQCMNVLRRLSVQCGYYLNSQKTTLKYSFKNTRVCSYHRNDVKSLEIQSPSPEQCKFGHATN